MTCTECRFVQKELFLGGKTRVSLNMWCVNQKDLSDDYMTLLGKSCGDGHVGCDSP